MPATEARLPAGRLAAWLLLFLMLLLAACSVRAAPAVPLEASPQGLSLIGRMDHLADADGRLGLDAVRQGEAAARFRTPAEAVQHGHDAAHWFRIVLRQAPGSPGRWLLVLPSVGAREVAFFGPFDAAGTALQAPVRTGQDLPYATRPLGLPQFTFPFTLPQGGDYTLYLRVASDSEHRYALSVWDAVNLLQQRQRSVLVDGLAYGLMAGMLLYNLSMAFVFRDRAHLYYVLSSAFALLTIAGFNGHVAQYLLPERPSWALAGGLVLPALWMFTGALFARSFLSLRRQAPRLYAASHLLLAATLLPLLLLALGLPRVAESALEAVALAGSALMLFAAVVVLRRGYPPAGWYLGGQSLLMVSTVAVVLDSVGLVSWPFVQANGLAWGACVEVVIFSLGLSARVRLLQRRHARLTAHATQLSEVAHSDPLTGLANRAGLAIQAARILDEPGLHALALLDLDRFKPINDEHGHEAGDAVLRAVAQRLRAELRPDDCVARLGGDEFVVLLRQAGDRARVQELALRLLARLREPVAHEGRQLQVEASLGIALAPRDGEVLADLLRAADATMYRVKREGRAGLAFHGD